MAFKAGASEAASKQVCYAYFGSVTDLGWTLSATLSLAKGCCRAKFWAKFPFWRGAVRGEVCREVCREVFHEVFGLVLLGHSEQKKKQTSAETSALNSQDSAQQNWRKFREELQDEVLQGDPRQPYLPTGDRIRKEVCDRVQHSLDMSAVPKRGRSKRGRSQKHASGMARVRLADPNGPKWTSLGQSGPKWTILVHFGLANAKIRFGIRSF